MEDDSLFRWQGPCQQFPSGEDGRYYLWISLVEDDSLFRWQGPRQQFPPGEDGRYYLWYSLVEDDSLFRWEGSCQQFPPGEDGRYYLCYSLVSVVLSANTTYRRRRFQSVIPFGISLQDRQSFFYLGLLLNSCRKA